MRCCYARCAVRRMEIVARREDASVPRVLFARARVYLFMERCERESATPSRARSVAAGALFNATPARALAVRACLLIFLCWLFFFSHYACYPPVILEVRREAGAPGCCWRRREARRCLHASPELVGGR